MLVRVAVQVHDASGACVPHAAIALQPLASSSRNSVLADERGRAEFRLAPGAYRITVGFTGFKESGREFEVTSGGNQTMEVTLDARPTDDPIELTQIEVPIETSAIATPYIPSQPLESPLNIRTVHNSEPELATKAQLERLIAAHDLRQWTFTHEIVIDEKSIPHSHPVLTLHTRHLKQDDELLSTYLHEQLHWFLVGRPADTKAAEEDLRKLYPNVPVGYPEGANDTESTYLHLLVCRLEQQADRAVLGEERTATAMQFWEGDHYRWVYRTVLADGAKIDEILKAHVLAEPDARVEDSGR